VTTAARPTAATPTAGPTAVVSAVAAPVAAALGTLQHQTCVRIFTDFQMLFRLLPIAPLLLPGLSTADARLLRAFDYGRGTISKFQDHANLFEFLLTSIDYIKFN